MVLCRFDKKRLIGSEMVFFMMILTIMLCFLSASNHLFPFPTVFVNFYSFMYVLFVRHGCYAL